ncbi:MAG: ChuX/HutX family heme-like substrate-binding protein [Flavobacteriales bacterium]
MIQIHSGPITNVVDARGWLNVLDPELNVHIREEAIATAWVVRKPTADGMVTALECYDAAGEQIIQLFGARKPGIPELEAWRAVVATVEAEQRA